MIIQCGLSIIDKAVIMWWGANNGINAEAKQLVSLKVFNALTFLAFVNGSGTFGPGYAGRYTFENLEMSVYD